MNDRFSAAMMEASVSELELSVRWFDRDLLSNTNRRETQVFEVEVDLRFLKMKKKIERKLKSLFERLCRFFFINKREKKKKQSGR